MYKHEFCSYPEFGKIICKDFQVILRYFKAEQVKEEIFDTYIS